MVAGHGRSAGTNRITTRLGHDMFVYLFSCTVRNDEPRARIDSVYDGQTKYQPRVGARAATGPVGGGRVATRGRRAHIHRYCHTTSIDTVQHSCVVHNPFL